MKKALTILVSTLGIIVFVTVTVLAYLTVDEYKPREIEEIEVEGASYKRIVRNLSIRLMSWNIGYGALGDNADFMMDGGNMVYTASKVRVEENLDFIRREVEKVDPSILLMQELDRNSARSFFLDEKQYFEDISENRLFHSESVYAPNFKVSFIPVPFPPIGRVEAGLVSFSEYKIEESERYALPNPFKWPLRAVNLKRCLEVSRLPVASTDKELVLINLHLEAYDSGEGKAAQTRMLKELIYNEIDKGNYVIAGGDFNQVFSSTDISAYPVHEGVWQAGVIDEREFGDQVKFCADSSVPSCRSLDKPLASSQDKSPQGFQYYIVDGFIVSSNIEVQNCHTEDLGFFATDHNPVVMDFRLK